MFPAATIAPLFSLLLLFFFFLLLLLLVEASPGNFATSSERFLKEFCKETGWNCLLHDVGAAAGSVGVKERNNNHNHNHSDNSYSNNSNIGRNDPSSSLSSSWKQLSSRRMLYDWWKKPKCTDRDIGISQSREMTSGVPQFVVEIYTTCVNECEPSDVHLRCAWFASTAVVNPRIFRRIGFDDCLVNGGRPIPRGQILRFAYQNSFMYSLSFKSAKFC